jgi:signal peptide peptidase SppA
MVKYPHVLLACINELWAMEPMKLRTITRFLLAANLGNRAEASVINIAPDWGKAEQDKARALTEKRDEIIRNKSGNVAVIPVFGALVQRADMFSELSGAASYQRIAQTLRGAVADPEIKAIVMAFDSPGGTVPGCEELAAELRMARDVKPLIGVADPLAASAAYWLLSQCTEVVAAPSSSAGSIGVYTIHEDVSELLTQAGIDVTMIFSGKYKVEGNEFEPLSEEAKQFIQQRVDQVGAKFIRDVAAGRGIDEKDVRETFGQGRMYQADELLKRGMIDRIGSLDDTLERFGVEVRPPAMRQTQAARPQAVELFVAKIAAGEPLTIREVERAMRGTRMFSRSEAELIASQCRFDKAQGDPGNGNGITGNPVRKTDPEVSRKLAQLRESAANFQMPNIFRKKED